MKKSTLLVLLLVVGFLSPVTNAADVYGGKIWNTEAQFIDGVQNVPHGDWPNLVPNSPPSGIVVYPSYVEAYLENYDCPLIEGAPKCLYWGVPSWKKATDGTLYAWTEVVANFGIDPPKDAVTYNIFAVLEPNAKLFGSIHIGRGIDQGRVIMEMGITSNVAEFNWDVGVMPADGEYYVQAFVRGVDVLNGRATVKGGVITALPVMYNRTTNQEEGFAYNMIFGGQIRSHSYGLFAFRDGNTLIQGMKIYR